MWTRTSSFAAFTSESDSSTSNFTKIPGIGNPALHMLQIQGQNINEESVSQGKQNQVQYVCTDRNSIRRFLHQIATI